MNAKQFLSSMVLRGVDFGTAKVPVVGSFCAFPLRVVFPTMAYERVTDDYLHPRVFLSVFMIGFLICFGLQAVLAAQAGTLGRFDGTFGPVPDPGGGPDRVMFLNDLHNLFNYVLLVPLYLVAGTGYMISLFSLKQRMAPISGDYGFSIDDSLKPLLSGTVAVGVFVALLVTLQAQYAIDIQTKSLHLFWFHGAEKCTMLGYNGYAYLVVNMFLAGFVILVALLHLELFRWSQILAKSIRTHDPTTSEANLFLNDGNRLKELFAPFTETAIWSKAFAMLLAINIYTWKQSGVSGGVGEELIGPCGVLSAQARAAALSTVEDTSTFFRFIFLLFIVIALWIVSLPRYRIQLEIFKLRQKAGVHEYFDIRMPWTIGWSVFIDLLLLSFFTTAIFGKGDLFALSFSFFE